MRYNVPVHQSGLYLICIIMEPSMEPSSTPVEGGNSRCAMLNSQHHSTLKGLQLERLTIEGLGA